MNLTRQDRRLLNELQRDATRNQSELAEIVGMSRTSCWRRIRAVSYTHLTLPTTGSLFVEGGSRAA